MVLEAVKHACLFEIHGFLWQSAESLCNHDTAYAISDYLVPSIDSILDSVSNIKTRKVIDFMVCSNDVKEYLSQSDYLWEEKKVDARSISKLWDYEYYFNNTRIYVSDGLQEGELLLVIKTYENRMNPYKWDFPDSMYQPVDSWYEKDDIRLLKFVGF